MADNDISRLPIHLATRLLLDSVSYSNPLPNWFETLTVNYELREQAIMRRVKQYLDGGKPVSPFEILVPKKNNQMARWVVPSLTDQIIFQACVSSFADKLDEQTLDKTRVFSCRYNRDPSRLALLENQVSAWKAFQDETKKRCQSDECVLQLDLENAFANVDRAAFFAFIRKFSPDGIVVKLLEVLHEAFAGNESGLPLMNDSGFFLGNAYLSEVDKLVSSHTPNFIRFVDDYRIFADSRSKLESLLDKISRDLQQKGFRINSHKLKLGSGEEYLEAISHIKYATAGDLGDYIDVAFGDIMQPKDLIAQISKTVEKPQDYLNQGFGRLQMASLRKLRLETLVGFGSDTSEYTVRYEFAKLLLEDTELLSKISSLLQSYSKDNSQTWRTLWILYLLQDLYFYSDPDGGTGSSAVLPEDLEQIVNHLKTSDAIPQVVRLWASDPGKAGKKLERQEVVEQLHDSSYVECGINYLKNE
jgi:hypothetical protein